MARRVSPGRIPMKKPVLSIDGARFDDLQGFARQISARVLVGHKFNGNLDA
jgi:hypothetical protein